MHAQSFTEAEQALRVANAAVSIAEGHGCLCGALCTLPQFSTQRWLQELLPDPGDDTALVDIESVGQVLLQVHDETQQALQGDEMDFALLLPDDSAPISERAAALAQWSQGFLYGFGIGAPSPDQRQYPETVNEVLADLSEIARAEIEVGDSEEQEQAYAELVEYLRAAVQLIHGELAAQRAARQHQQLASH